MKERRFSEANIRREDAMMQKLDATFQQWPSNAGELIRNNEDLAFLTSIKADRLATFSALDVKSRAQEKQQQEREVKAAD